jgi:hypothetical protein
LIFSFNLKMSDDDFWAFDTASVTTNLNDLWGDEDVNNTTTPLPVVAPIINPVNLRQSR